MDPKVALLTLILLPAAVGLLVLPLKKSGGLRSFLTLAATAANLALAIWAFGREATVNAPWVGPAMEFSLRLYHFSGFILLAAAGFSLLVVLYATAFMKNHPRSNQFMAYLLFSMTLVNGATLADNLVVMLFFWEGLLATLLGLIAIGREGAFRTATKAFILVGVSDVCMMAGIAITGYLAKAAGAENYLTMSAIAPLHLTTSGLGGLGMTLLMIGAISKAGSMPFHSWIPDAAVDAPLPFMAFLPASLEKLLGIYFLARITLDLYHVQAHSWSSMMMMIVGAATILLAVMMALVQKDYKRLLSYHAISQVGYMILGVGTALPIGIVGGLFHMINHAMYKSCLFLTAGSVEKQTGTTDLAKLGGIAGKMPITFVCFFLAAAAISGVPPLNGFYSKELVYAAAMDRSMLFYLAALLGTFLTAASFLKLGHAAYLGRRSSANDAVHEAPAAMLLPMIVIAGGCVLFGVMNSLPLHHLIKPILGTSLEGEHFAGFWPHNWMLAGMAVLTLGAALVNHLLGAKINGGALEAVDHIHYAPLLAGIYRKAENRFFDPYNIGIKLFGAFSSLGWRVDRAIDWTFDRGAVGGVGFLTAVVRGAHNGSHALYVLWALAGAAAVITFLVVGS